jgi:hypothetical protein
MSVLVTVGAAGVGSVSGWLLGLGVVSVRSPDWRTVGARAGILPVAVGEAGWIGGSSAIPSTAAAAGAAAVLAAVWQLRLVRHVRTHPDPMER